VSVRLPRYLRAIRPGDVVIDAGAHVGRFSTMFAARGAKVLAFEPHPTAFAALSLITRDWPNITCVNKAVSDRNGSAPLYFHRRGRGFEWAFASSLMSQKRNVDPEQFVTVETVRLADVMLELGPIRLLKMDIEGAEYDVLQDLIDTGAHLSTEKIVVETHERNRAFLPAHRALVARIRRDRIRNIELNWI